MTSFFGLIILSFDPIYIIFSDLAFGKKKQSRYNRTLGCASSRGVHRILAWGGPNLSREVQKKRFARSAKKILNFAPRKTYFCPPKINFLPYYFLVWNYFGGGPCPPQNQLWGGHGPLSPPPCGRPWPQASKNSRFLTKIPVFP